MNEDWWVKLKSRTVRDRLPGSFLITFVGFLSDGVVLILLFTFRPWSHEAKYISAPVNDGGVVFK